MIVRLYRAAGSLKTGVVILAALTLASFFGVLIPQGLDPQRYITQWGTAGGTMLLRLGLDRLFSTLWYNSLLGLFSLNIFLCTVNRIISIGKSAGRWRFLDGNQIAKLAFHVRMRAPGTVPATAETVRRFFRARRFSVYMNGTAASLSIEARQGLLREVGLVLVHLSVLPLLVGGLVGKMTGFSYSQHLAEGESVQVRERPFSVRCDSFAIDMNERGDISDYRSRLTLLGAAGDTLMSRTIEVNHPLVYRGIKFYQSSYSVDPVNTGAFTLMVTGPQVGPVGKKVSVEQGSSSTIESTGITVSAVRFFPDFYYDMETKTPHNRSDRHNNPALFVTVTRVADTLFARWVFQRFGVMHHTDDEYSVSLLSYGQKQSTGLLIKENPGGGIIWFGIVFMSIGVILVFWAPRRRIRITVEECGEGKVVLHVGTGLSHRDPGMADYASNLFKRLCRELGGTIELEMEKNSGSVG